MPRSKAARDELPEHFESIEQAADFWESHDLTEYSDVLEEVDFQVDMQRRRHLVALDPELAEKLAVEAHKRGLSTETLINLWLRDKLEESVA